MLYIVLILTAVCAMEASDLIAFKYTAEQKKQKTILILTLLFLICIFSLGINYKFIGQ